MSTSPLPWRLRTVANWVNLSTPLGLCVAMVGGATHTRRPCGLHLATNYRLKFPVASAFTVGSVVLTRHSTTWIDEHPELLRHEERHSDQYVVCGGLPFIALYLAACSWSKWRTGDWAVGNIFERMAGLEEGHYVVPAAGAPRSDGQEARGAPESDRLALT